MQKHGPIGIRATPMHAAYQLIPLRPLIPLTHLFQWFKKIKGIKEFTPIPLPVGLRHFDHPTRL